MKTRALFSLLLASLLLFASLPALALDAEPAPDSVVSPGDTIAYTYVLPADMTNCVLRFSLSSGVSLQPDSVQVKASGPYEVIYGSDGCVIMADALDKGDTLVFVAQVGEEAVEVWAKLVAADGSIQETDGYAAHTLALAEPGAQEEPSRTQQPAAAQQTSSVATGIPGYVYLFLLLLVCAVLAGLCYQRGIFPFRRAAAQPPASPAGPADPSAPAADDGQETTREA